MAISEQEAAEEYQFEEDDYSGDEESDPDYVSDRESDSDYDIVESSRSKLSNLSIKKKAKSCTAKDKDAGREGDPGEVKIVLPELDQKDKDTYENVQKIILAGQVEKLKVDQCKVYLRKNGLRLSGNKDTLIQRIKQHIEIVNGSGEKQYPAASFVLNCKGDACTGDVVMFEQNVYEMFNLASRSATGPPCGTRIVAGRIVKESYGASKQQHTFTIEVLWSKGEKPLPPLHPLLIKGRNLYRLKTLRQRWEDEGERQRILMEKHMRGGQARFDREARIQDKEMRKMLKPNRSTRNGISKNQAIQSTKPVPNLDSRNHAIQSAPFIYQDKPAIRPQQFNPNLVMPNSIQEVQHQLTKVYGNANHYKQPLANVNYYPPPSQLTRQDQRSIFCRHYAKGRCYYGDNCKFLHEGINEDAQRNDPRGYYGQMMP